MSKTYRTVQGDTFDSVAYRLWGEPRLAHLLMRANPSFMDVVIFSGGVELTVPGRKKDTARSPGQPAGFHQRA